jgi:hypothetical protein
MVEPVMGNTNNTTKIIIHSNHDLNSYLTNPTLLTYLKEELMSFEHKNLTTIPQNVGFIEQVMANWETTLLHKSDWTPFYQQTLQYSKYASIKFMVMTTK